MKKTKRRRRDVARMTDQEFMRHLDHRCAYCGLGKSERPPLWCVRRHEGWEADQYRLMQETR